MVAVVIATTASSSVDIPGTGKAALAVRDQDAIADGVALLPGGFVPGHQPDGNTVVFRGSDGLVVLDTGRHPEHSQKILEYARNSGLPIAVVVNSHWHLDHISGNPRLRAAYPDLKVYASPAIDGAMSGFLARSKLEAQQFLAQPGDAAMQAEVRADVATIDSGKAVYPDVQVRASGEYEWAGRQLHVGFEGPAVTAGDLWLYDRKTDTLASGDLVTLPVPFFDTACPANWSAALGHLDAMPFKRLVPGHGPLLDRAQFSQYRKAFDQLLKCADSKAETSVCREAWISDAGALLADESQKQLARGLLDYYVGQVLRDANKRRETCASPRHRASLQGQNGDALRGVASTVLGTRG